MRYYEFEVLGIPDIDGEDMEIEDYYHLDVDPIRETMKIDLDNIGAYKSSKLVRDNEKSEEIVVVYTSGFEILVLCSMTKFEEVLYNQQV